MKPRKYIAHVKNTVSNDEFVVEGGAPTPQEFHKIVLNEHIDYQKDVIEKVTNEKDKVVFDNRRGFSGS